ncbi:hypothetical protein J2X20_003320 [Pelomonas saccharophila]|uniref:Helix-turn-helix domain-containing protein n=2 Tax=Roseateles saccharophilus TaxID=304 RepID=A0ABU1YP67_ROSSA|nr:hypothetical protein [Roseateles saccharophilus]
MRDRAYLRQAWQLKAVTACSKHGRRLTDSCHACGSQVAAFGVVDLRCSCGVQLGEGADGSACSELEMVLAKAAARALARQETSSTFDGLSRLVLFMGQFNSPTFPQKPGKLDGFDRLDLACSLASSTDRLLSSWPTQFDSLLKERLEHVRNSSFSARLPEVFGPLYRVLYKRLAGAEFQFLRDAFEAFLREHWWGLLCGRNRRLSADTVGGHRRVSRKHAVRELGLTEGTLKRLVQSKAVRADVVSGPSGRQFTFLDEDELPQLRDMAKAALTLQQASERLALPRKIVRQMIESKLLSLVADRSNSAGAWMISGELPRIPASSVAPPKQALRSVLRYWRLTDKERMSVVAGAVGGELLSFAGTSHDGEALGHACINVAALRHWIEAARATQAKTDFTLREAARDLGIKEEVAYELARRGLLRCARTGRGARVAPDEIARFAEAYVSLATLAKGVGTSPRSLLSKLGVRPVSGPSIDGCRQYFFSRSDLKGSTTCPVPGTTGSRQRVLKNSGQPVSGDPQP